MGEVEALWDVGGTHPTLFVFVNKMLYICIMWMYKGEEITSVEQAPEGAVGFVYLMVSKETNRKYIGKKLLFYNRKRKFGKKEIAALTNKRLKKWEAIRKESDWKEYQSSSDEVLQEIANGAQFSKEILYWTYSKTETTYLEAKEMFVRCVLESNDYYNVNILGKFFKGSICNDERYEPKPHKFSEEGRRNLHTRHNKAVIQCDLDWNEIQEFSSVLEASSASGIGRSSIWRYCNNPDIKVTKRMKFKWKYKTK